MPSRGRSRKGTAGLWTASALVSGGALALLLSQVELDHVGRLAGAVEVRFLLLALVMIVVETVAAAVRLKILLPRRPGAGIAGCLRITNLHAVYLVLLPARLGEIAYLFLLTRVAGQRAGAAVGNLVYQRLSDVAMVAFLFALALLLVAGGGEAPATLSAGIGAVMAMLVTGWLGVNRIATAVAATARRVLGRRGRVRGGVLRGALQARRWTRQVTDVSLRLGVIALTAVAWIAATAAVGFLFRAFGAPLDLGQMVFAGIAIQLIGALPVYTIGGLGVTEAGLAGLLVLFGLEPAAAVALALAVRLGLVAGQLVVFLLLSPLHIMAPQRAAAAP